MRMKLHTFDHSDPRAIAGFLENFKPTCEADEIHKGAAVWLFHFSVNKTVSAVLDARLYAESTDKNNKRTTNGKTRYFTAYPREFIPLLKRYETYGVIAETESRETSFAQPSGTTAYQYAEALVTKTLCCEDVCERYTLNKTTMRNWDASIRNSMSEY